MPTLPPPHPLTIVTPTRPSEQKITQIEAKDHNTAQRGTLRQPHHYTHTYTQEVAKYHDTTPFTGSLGVDASRVLVAPQTICHSLLSQLTP